MPRKLNLVGRAQAIKLRRVMKDLLNEQACERVLAGCFPEQRAFIEDPAELKAALATRRCGKTRAAATYLLYTALKYPGSVCVYVHLTRQDAKNDMLTKNRFIPILLDEYKIEGAETNYSELTITLPNRSVIWLTGIDSTPDQSRNLLGKKYRLLIIDEAGSFRQDLNQIVMRIRPAMSQGTFSGTIALIGTPENNRNFFYRVTCTDTENENRDPGWSLHEWSYENNPYERDALRKQVIDLIRDYPGIDRNPSHALYPTFQQHYRGRWVIDRNALVYAYDPKVNGIDKLPDGNWRYAAGVDLGFGDPTTIMVVAYREHDPTLYVIDAFKRKEMPVSEVGSEIVRFKQQYGISRFISDHDPQVTTDIENRFGIHIEPADKLDKVPFITLMNGEYLKGRIKILRDPRLDPLIEELESLVWDKKHLFDGKKREDQNKPNHCCDALLYVWKEMFYFLARPKEEKQADPFALYTERLRNRVEKKMISEKKRRGTPHWKHI